MLYLSRLYIARKGERVKLNEVTLHYFDAQFALAPNTLASHPGPARRLQIRHELAQLALVLGHADEASDAVNLASFAAAPHRIHMTQLAARHLYGIGPRTHGAKVYFERTRSVQGTKRADAIAASREQYAELGTLASLQLRRRLELDPQAAHLRWRIVQQD